MKRIIQLNVDDIKNLINEKYNVNPKWIEIEAWGPSQDGSYYSGGCIFSFEEEYINSDLKETKE